MELIWGIWFFFGLITGTLMFLGVSSANERLFEGKHDKHRPVPLPHGGDDRMGEVDIEQILRKHNIPKNGRLTMDLVTYVGKKVYTTRKETAEEMQKRIQQMNFGR